jgi:hypothetical protein
MMIKAGVAVRCLRRASRKLTLAKGTSRLCPVAVARLAACAARMSIHHHIAGAVLERLCQRNCLTHGQRGLGDRHVRAADHYEHHHVRSSYWPRRKGCVRSRQSLITIPPRCEHPNTGGCGRHVEEAIPPFGPFCKTQSNFYDAPALTLGKFNSKVRIIMADDLSNRGPQDGSRINLSEEYEVRYWTMALGVSEDHLRQLVKEHGAPARPSARRLARLREDRDLQYQ